jgi:hypothetical protein
MEGNYVLAENQYIGPRRDHIDIKDNKLIVLTKKEDPQEKRVFVLIYPGDKIRLITELSLTEKVKPKAQEKITPALPQTKEQLLKQKEKEKPQVVKEEVKKEVQTEENRETPIEVGEVGKVEPSIEKITPSQVKEEEEKIERVPPQEEKEITPDLITQIETFLKQLESLKKIISSKEKKELKSQKRLNEKIERIEKRITKLNQKLSTYISRGLELKKKLEADLEKAKLKKKEIEEHYTKLIEEIKRLIEENRREELVPGKKVKVL